MVTSPMSDDPTLIIEAAPARKKADPSPEPAASPPPRRLRTWLLRGFGLFVVTAVLGSVAFVIYLSLITQDLPTIRSLDDYRPKQATVVYGAGGEVVSRFATERRTVVPYERIPRVVIDAVTAAEDAEFFQHGGLDYLGILRCAVKSALRGRTVCGGSTISQQMVKTFLLTPEKKLTRKLKEAILTKRVEESLTKEEILYLYLNQIYFGHGAYGIQEAAKVYFGKNVEHLTLPEAALLAGLPQLPTRLDPYKYPDRAMRRRRYVLGQMLQLGRIDQAAHDAAVAAPIDVDWRQAEGFLDNNNYYAAHVRALLEEQVGKDAATDGGYRVYTGMDPKLQAAAEDAVRDGLRELDKRQGWRGPQLHLEPDEQRGLSRLLEARLSTVAPSLLRKDEADKPVIWDLSRVKVPKGGDWLDLDKMVGQARFRRLETGTLYGGLVAKVDDPSREAIVDLGGVEVRLPMRTGLSWARKFDTFRATRRPKVPSDVLRVGDVVLVRPTIVKRGADGVLAVTGELEQEPMAQAALVAIDATTREVRALVGGYGVGAGTFNRATQARRQAGSTFKPLLYTAAFETGDYTTISECQDAPRVYRDPFTGQSWKPKNYGGKFDGIISLREALTKSKNLCSVELIDKIGVDRVIDTARRAGVESALPRSLTLGLGAGDVTPLEMVNAYATIATGGKKATPIFVRKIVDGEGATRLEAKDDAVSTISAAVAYQVTSLMQSVVQDGTAQRVKVLDRPVAGKTGTTNEARNAWFIGFTPSLVVGVWVGFDDNEPLGTTETGGRAAIPIWLDFMKVAVEGTPPQDFVAPAGIVFAFVDPKSGKLASPDAPDAVSEPFVAGTEPTELQTNAKSPTQFGLDDYELR